MGKVCIQDMTTKNPIQLIGYEAGVCWGSNIDNENKNYTRGLDCLSSGHGRTFEFPTVYMTLDGYSARVIREFYTHIGGAPTRLQESTRYIDYAKNGFEYITPPTIAKDEFAKVKWDALMTHINNELKGLEEYGIPKEDIANGLPLGMTTKVVVKMNLRTLIDMSHQRMCTRAYWEFREMFKDICNSLKNYSEEWQFLVEHYFNPKCLVYGYCNERKGCGRMPQKKA